ncbi:penicillin acylase family protein [Edaphobacter bradus]|uniref:penicillin acylase family protein n=1 Tax=Edaphobacter bradus TaxID=2259016 RepID=UPI0021DFAC55|nr:penicillin acylase family protein [Edaphobacter bradus]
MMPFDPASPEPILLTRRVADSGAVASPAKLPYRNLRRFGWILLSLLILVVLAFTLIRLWTHQALRGSLPQIDGSLSIAGLSAPVTVQRDSHGVPHIRAASLDDLVLAQGFVTAQDRLFQMDLLRRHAAGELAEILGANLLIHDRTQRTLQLRAAADRVVAALPADQLHYLELYARGVNDSIELQRAHLPLEFRILRYKPAPWTPRDSLLVGLAMFEDLTNTFPVKLSREAIAAHLSPELVDDLYPVGSWRDHPPTQPAVDLTAPQQSIPDIPLDESQTRLTKPATPATNPGDPEPALSLPKGLDSETWDRSATASTSSAHDLLALQQSLRNPVCEGCLAGSNNWVVAGSRTASGKPLLSNDMHLAHSVPGIWYEADLESPASTGEFHAAGVSLPGLPFIVVGHNSHIAWGFTNLGADVQDIYIEQLRGSGQSEQFLASDGSWQPVLHQTEVIHVHNGHDVTLDVAATRHGNTITPILSSLLPSEKRPLSLRWTIYDPATLDTPLLSINSATDWTSFLAAFSTFGGPAQNVVYADDQGHIGYHAVGYIPVRGSLAQPTPLTSVPVAVDTAHEWSGYIPFDKLPQAFDPPNGVLATANARVAPEGYPYPITLDWAAPYRNERIWKVLLGRDHLTPADMLALQTDIYSDLDHDVAQRLAYAIDHSGTKDRRLHQAADLLRNWDGNVTADSPAAPIAIAARNALWALILAPRLTPATSPSSQSGPGEPLWQLYSWGEKSYAGEQIIMHTPDRWLPSTYHNWDELLTAAVARGLASTNAPADLTHWSEGKSHPVEIEHPVFTHVPLHNLLIGLPIGTGVQPQSGDTTTVKQVDRSFGPSERLTADLGNLDNSTLNLVLGESGNPASPWFLDQWPAWYKGTTFPMPFSAEAVRSATTHTLTLTPN